MNKQSYNDLQKRLKTLEKSEKSRKRIEDALRDSENKYKILSENIALGFFRSTSGSMGSFIEVNSAFLKILGYKKKNELYSKNVADIYLNPVDRLKFSDKLSSEGFLKNEELIFKKKSGKSIIVSETAIAVKDNQGNILYFAGIIEDITDRKKAEEKLQIQKTYLEYLFNSAPEAIVWHDNDDFVLNINEEFTRLFGYSREEAIGKPINTLVAPDHLQDEASHLSKTVINGHRVEFESKRKSKDGKLVDVSILGAPIFHKGKQMGVYAIYRNISERKKAEEELIIQKTYLERLFNSAPEAIVLHGNNDLILDVNDEFIKIFGYSREEAIGKPINDLLASKDFEQEANRISENVIRGEKIDLESKRKRKDGSLIDVSILGAPIIHEDKQIGDYAIYRDITERKRSEEEIHIQKTYLEILFNSAPEAIVWHDNNDIVLNVNDEFTKTFGYSREETIGKPINDLVAPPDLLDEATLLSKKVVHGDRVEIETKRKRKDGKFIDVSILGAPIIHEGRQMGVYAIYRDISERKKAEETRVRFREETRMARNIQQQLLPQTNPSLSGYDIAGKNIPALNVGGDYFDFIEIDESRVAITLGDVSGKGLAASLVMANLQATIRGQAYYNVAVNDCLERSNNLLFRSTDSKTFVSLFYGILDTNKHTLSYANAGQNMPFIFTEGKKTVSLKTRGIALGMKENVSYQVEERLITNGDIIVIYSDGISEAMNERMTEFGDEKIKRVIKSNLNKSSNEIIEGLFSTVNKHFGNASQNDDMTMIVLQRK
jgi:PAS domain S-box-containing protein